MFNNSDEEKTKTFTHCPFRNMLSQSFALFLCVSLLLLFGDR